MSFQVDLEAIDPAGFQISRREEGVLVQPHRTKLRWREEELPLRSLWLDPQGRVRSAGWPKFFNLGENEAHDGHFRGALAAGQVQFSEKMDGTLIIADHLGPGRPSLRTRGQLHLGEFDGPVRSLISARFPGLLSLLGDPSGPCVHHSLLFEFVSPEHTVVIPYSEPGLFFLGSVCKRTLRPSWGGEVAEEVHRRASVPPAPVLSLPTDEEALRRHLEATTGKEGFVARFLSPSGEALLLKLKTDEYLRLHGNRATLGERGSRRLAFLLSLTGEPEVTPALAALGFDHEAIQVALWHLRPYFAARAAAAATFAWLRDRVAAAPPGARRVQVEFLREALAASPTTAEPRWLAAAIKLLDGREQDAWWILESHLLDEPVPTLRAWVRNQRDEIARVVASLPGS